jgi:hypothetical protein
MGDFESSLCVVCQLLSHVHIPPLPGCVARRVFSSTLILLHIYNGCGARTGAAGGGRMPEPKRPGTTKAMQIGARAET